ncbi:hypothetical protein ACZ87_00783 [Candidatus Erwinia dacicola]|uniref:Uncharacterized protein n=1 Tax=Candidatus Erwinia dacicola TaxID=252393 RepID=A0A328TPM3_9GAMM|nr:hypothetical protein ACZ87_00783 [Candidatus Erwinia dacicola]
MHIHTVMNKLTRIGAWRNSFLSILKDFLINGQLSLTSGWRSLKL